MSIRTKKFQTVLENNYVDNNFDKDNNYYYYNTKRRQNYIKPWINVPFNSYLVPNNKIESELETKRNLYNPKRRTANTDTFFTYKTNRELDNKSININKRLKVKEFFDDSNYEYKKYIILITIIILLIFLKYYFL